MTRLERGMHKGNICITNQDRRSFAVLSVVALCLKTLLPFITALFISQAASAQSQFNSNILDTELEITRSLQYICTPAGIFLLEGSNSDDYPGDIDHCDHCLAGNFIHLNHKVSLQDTPCLTQGSSTWHIADQGILDKAQGYSLPSTRAPPLA